ncbi:MAG: ECF RNA polymerase sigma factor SigL [Candidatus Ordinivivax streblomastigis]|uniref:RNA polymerase sigma factor n=1 Tax=Candidatus Ordinivivax streblomastigis TaxID=2540710 RepID=A0A5M8NYI0_9BACT|nr:MAG: ECF RNA polymerase sigma factor SigL [Candidatus Ordinivivax streblomastigis]
MENNDYLNLKLLQQGSVPAFENLYNLYSGKLYHFILKISNRDTWQAEELVQRTFIKVWETHHCIDPDKSFISYLCVIAKNMLLNEWEHQTIEYVYQEYFKQHVSAHDYSTDKEVDLKFLEDVIDKLTKQLPPARRQIFILSRKNDYSIKEIAKKLNLAETTVQTQLTKALTFMKEQLSKY